MWDKDKVMKPYRVAGKLGATPGFPGPPNAKAAEVLTKYLIVNMFAVRHQGPICGRRGQGLRERAQEDLRVISQ